MSGPTTATLRAAPIYRTSAVTLDNQIYKIGGSIGSFTYTGLADHHVQCPACPEADLFILKDDGVDSVVIGETVTYTMRLPTRRWRRWMASPWPMRSHRP